jgi:hypothetical protein
MRASTGRGPARCAPMPCRASTLAVRRGPGRMSFARRMKAIQRGPPRINARTTKMNKAAPHTVQRAPEPWSSRAAHEALSRGARRRPARRSPSPVAPRCTAAAPNTHPKTRDHCRQPARPRSRCAPVGAQWAAPGKRPVARGARATQPSEAARPRSPCAPADDPSARPLPPTRAPDDASQRGSGRCHSRDRAPNSGGPPQKPTARPRTRTARPHRALYRPPQASARTQSRVARRMLCRAACPPNITRATPALHAALATVANARATLPYRASDLLRRAS